MEGSGRGGRGFGEGGGLKLEEAAVPGARHTMAGESCRTGVGVGRLVQSESSVVHATGSSVSTPGA